MQTPTGSLVRPLAYRLTRALRRARGYAMAVEALPLADGTDAVTLAGRFDRDRIELGTRVQRELLRQGHIPVDP